MSTSKGTCSVAGCERPSAKRDWCGMHYQRWWKWGDPLRQALAPTERFWSKVDVRGPDECWPWLGCCGDSGYGQFSIGRGSRYVAHRFAYELLVGPIPDDLQLDHTCHNASDCTAGRACLHRRCVNPAHLEPVTGQINVLRGHSPNAAKTHCPQGHPYEGDNLYGGRGRGGRRCRECARRSNQRSRDKKKARG